MASNAKSGEKLFMSKCAQCHTVDRGAGHKQGPNLNGLFGKRFGCSPDYSYSAANKNMAVVWGESTLQDYLLDPKKNIPRTKMDFPGLKEPQERRDVIAYLKEQSVSSPFLNSKTNPFHIQRYIPRSWKKGPCSTLPNFLKEEMENDPPMCSPKPSVHLLIDSIRCLSTQGQLSEAFKSFSLLQRHSSSSYFLLQPISSLLSVSTNLEALPQGKQVHAHIISLGFLDNSFLTSRLSSFYSTVGLLSDARTIVEDSRTQHAFPWNLLISAYVRKGFWMDAILAYKKMVERRSEIDKFTCPSVLRACSEICNLHLGRVVHGRIEITGLQHDLFIQNALVSMYAKCGAMKIARKLFDLMSERDIVTWNSLISGYSSMRMLNETFELLEKMQLDSKMNTVTWNTIATVNSQMGSHLEALELISKMRICDTSTDSVSLVIGLDSCSRMGYLRQGKEIHGLAFRLHYNELENVSNALITMYSKCKQIEVAYRLFRMRTSKSLITWNAIIAGFAALDQEEEAFLIFREMIRSQIQPNYVTMMTVLPLCAHLKNLHYGREIHCYITRHRFDNYQLLSNSLIDMYSKNGRISAAQYIFDGMNDYDVVSYTSMIAGYGMDGEGMKALNLFVKMTNSGIKPDSTAMVNVLSACSHSGLVTEGEILFKKIMGLYGIVPQVEHYSCMVDLFGKAGLLSKAEELITQMPFEPSTCMLATLVQACRAHGSREIGVRVAKRLLHMKPDHPSHYVLVANMYAYCRNWEELARVRAVMSDKGIIESYLLLGGLVEHMRELYC